MIDHEEKLGLATMWEKWSSCRETRKTIGEDGALDAMENPRLKRRFGTKTVTSVK